MPQPRVIRPLRPLRDVNAWRRRIVYALLLIASVVFAIVWWDNREAADSIVKAVHMWQ